MKSFIVLRQWDILRVRHVDLLLLLGLLQELLSVVLWLMVEQELSVVRDGSVQEPQDLFVCLRILESVLRLSWAFEVDVAKLGWSRGVLGLDDLVFQQSRGYLAY